MVKSVFLVELAVRELAGPRFLRHFPDPRKSLPYRERRNFGDREVQKFGELQEFTVRFII